MVDLKTRPFYLTEEEISWIKNQTNSLTIEQKIGQLFLVLGDSFSDEKLQELVKSSRVGGILFRPASKNEIKNKISYLNKISRNPLIFAANCEEGASGAISDGISFGSQMSLAACDDSKLVESFAKSIVKEAKEVGINWTFSPVSDIDMNFQNPIMNIRTLGSDANKVKRYATIQAKTFQHYGLIACAKHFPGDGVDYRDQHLHPSVNSLTAKRWRLTYGSIYKNLIKNDLLSIMVGHILLPSIEKEIDPNLKDNQCLPASLSSNLIQGLLRKELDFNGLVITDATIMGGYTMMMNRKKALVTSINSGIDMFCFNTDFEEDYNFLLESYKSGELNNERLNDALLRIFAIKAKTIFEKGAPIRINTKKVAEMVADKSITLVKNEQNILPIAPEKYPNIRLIILGKDEIDGEKLSLYAKDELEKNGFNVTIYKRDEDAMHGVGGLSTKRLTLYIANYPTLSNQTTIRISFNPIHALDTPRFPYEEPYIFLSLGNPYHLQDVPKVKVYINGYGCTKTIFNASLNKLLGLSPFLGKSPVDAFCGLVDTHY